MKTIFALAFAATAVLSSAALAQSNAGQQPSPATSQSLIAPYTPPGASIPTTPRHLFSIGNLPVGVWAPVEPPYDSRANRTAAANPAWWDDGAY
jgi:hypothetical protein